MEKLPTDNLFDQRVAFPDAEAMRRFNSLVGIDDAKTRLVRSIGILVNPDGLRKWGEKFHQENMLLLDLLDRRPPLVIFAGDVGTGKTELATSIGDPVARQEDISVILFSLSLSTRGSGRVGEMTQLLGGAFEETYNEAKKLKHQGKKATGAVILLVDEADAIVQSRENSQMHHEDRAGVNTFIRGIDRLAEQHLPAAVILCTNRLGAVDPAVRRRAAEIFLFRRPNKEQRHSVLEPALKEVGFSDEQVDEIVKRTGPTQEHEHGFTYSDLTQRLLPTIVIDAYPENAVTYERALEVLTDIQPTKPFDESILTHEQ